MFKSLTFVVLGLTVFAADHTVRAFEPAVDQQGPLTVRIDGPAKITETDVAFDVRVSLKNSARQPLSGELSFSSIDGWKCSPAGKTAFSVGAESEVAYDFKVTPQRSTYAALYPLHARAQFEWQEARLTAHPILILESAAEPPAVQKPLPWEPFVIQPDRSLALAQIPHRAVIAVFGGKPKVMATGWTGQVQPNRGSVYVRQNFQLGDSLRDAIGIHPPWSEGQIGSAWIEYPLTLPATTPIKLRFATAMSPGGKGDGVTFRVRAVDFDAPPGHSGEIVFERHSAAQVWEQGAAELSKFAGKTIRLQLESHPGPEKNTSYDQSYWSEPTLIAGSPPKPNAFPPTQAAEAASQISLPCGNYVVDIRPGQRGLLDAAIGLLGADQRSLWIDGFEIRVAGVQLEDPSAPVTLTDVKREPIENGVQLRHHFITPRGDLELVGAAVVKDETLRVRWTLANAPPDQPWQVTRIESVSTGPLSDPVHRLYAGHGNVIESPGAYNLAFDGHRLSTSFVGLDFVGGFSLLEAVDLPPDALRIDPKQRRCSLHTAGNATFTFIPGDNVWGLCRHYRKVNGLQAAGGVEKLAGRYVFDLWGGRYQQTAENLKRAFRYGLTDAAVVWHNWQRWGYDYRLPEIYPPHSRGGSEDELRELIDTCRQQGVLIALHDNYIDFYPDAKGFSYPNVVAFDNRGRPVKAWLNEGREAQSYRYRADRVTPFLQGNLHRIHKQLGPTAYFIDVWSSTKPYDYWTSDGRYFDAVSTRDSWGEHFAWIRNLLGHQAPQISESGHDQLIGWLDGAQTNHLRVGKPVGDGRYSWSVWNMECSDAERTPWFDAVHHDRFVLHGAGYSSRYQAGLETRMHGIYSDDYLTTEVLTGHPAMVSDAFGHDVVRKYWLTHDLSRALAMRTIAGVQYVDDDLHRQHVRWSGDAEVWVNRGKSPWTVGNVCLPQYGFLAHIPTDRGQVFAAIHQRDGLIVEQARSPDALYVNARGSLGQHKRIRPSVSSVQQKDARAIALDFVWQTDEPIPNGFRPFVHFVDGDGEIAFQATVGALPWSDGKTGRFIVKAIAQIPAEHEAGDEFELRVGVYHPGSGGARLLLSGDDDGERRVRLGTVVLTGDGNKGTSIAWTPRKPSPNPYLGRNNTDAKPVDFGWVVTAGSCRLTRDDDGVRLTPLPDEFAGATWQLRWDQLPWNPPRPRLVEAISESGEVLWKRALQETIVIEHDPAAFAYRFVK